MSGNTVAVSAPFEWGSAPGINGLKTNGTRHSGAVYVFVRNGGGWSLQAYIKPPVPRVEDYFSRAVFSGFEHRTLALDGDTLVVGHYRDRSGSTGIGGDPTDASADSSSAVFVYVPTERRGRSRSTSKPPMPRRMIALA